MERKKDIHSPEAKTGLHTVKCDMCEGSGEIRYIQNSAAFYDGWEDPIVVTDTCEDCGGEGIVRNKSLDIR